MLARCYNENDIGYHNYGGRGITVCGRWKEDYDTFFADMGECPEGLTLERTDTNGNYEPGNCRWATYTEQGRNRRNNTRISFKGHNLTLSEWAEKLEISPETLLDRLRKMPIEKAMTKGLLVNWSPGKHGTIGTYTNQRCRCSLCVKAWSNYKKAAYQRTKEARNARRQSIN